MGIQGTVADAQRMELAALRELVRKQEEQIQEARRLAHEGIMALLDHNLPVIRQCLDGIKVLGCPRNS